jgi:predicted phosphodiesterase
VESVDILYKIGDGDENEAKRRRRAAFDYAEKNEYDIIIYGHDHLEPCVKKYKNRLVIDTGTMQDGRCEFIRLHQMKEIINSNSFRNTIPVKYWIHKAEKDRIRVLETGIKKIV